MPATLRVVIPAKAGIQCVRIRGLPGKPWIPRLRGDDGRDDWIPAAAGMTAVMVFQGW